MLSTEQIGFIHLSAFWVDDGDFSFPWRLTKSGTGRVVECQDFPEL